MTNRLSMDDLTKSILDEVESTPDKENYSYGKTAEVSGGNDKNYATGFGLVVTICAVALLFGGDVFVWWNVSWEAESTTPMENGNHFELIYPLEFNIEEIKIDVKMAVWDAEDSSKEDLTEGALNEKNSTKYDDDDCLGMAAKGGCEEMNTVFTNIKYMLYGLLICGILLAFLGQNEMEYTSAVAAIGALISAGILIYTFIALPPAFEKDSETDGDDGFFKDTMDQDPAFFLNVGKEEYDANFETDVESYSKAMPGIAYFIPVITLTLCGYLIIYNRD